MSRSKARRAANRRRREQASAQPQTAESKPRVTQATATVASPSVARTSTIQTASTQKPGKQPEKEERESVRLECPGIETITDENYASKAEGLMREYSQRSFGGLTTTKLRGIYSLIMNVYARATTPYEYERCKPDIQYLKVRMAYEAGRENSVKDFLGNTNLMRLIDAVIDFEQFKLYCRYAEALVAYFKFFGGKDK